MRRKPRPTLTAALVVTLPAALLAGPHALAQASPGGGGTGAPRSVTLLTGDRVSVDGRGRVAVDPAEGREDIVFATQRVDGHVRVVPSDAELLLARGRIDTRLFDVTALTGMGYDDAARADLPLIVTYDKGRTLTEKDAARARATVERRLPAVNGTAVSARKTDATALWETLTATADDARHTSGGRRDIAPGVERIWLDGKREAALDRSVPQIGAPAAWKAGYDGTGVTVAVLDTGIDTTHPDLADRVVAERNFSDDQDTVDRNGHGTHVASTVAGSGAASAGTHRGVAPGARLLNGKVLDESGSGYDSGIIAGLQWAVDQGAEVVNLSLGGEDTEGTDPLEEAVQKLSADTGTLFVVAAGNDGESGARTLGSPGTAPAALTVGAVDRADVPARFSSQGPTADGALKPDVTAPGTAIVAARAAEGRQGDPVGERYTSMSGTSMATPHVAGAAAILAQRHPDWDAQELKAALTASAKPAPAVSAYVQGSGRIDVAAALEQRVTTSPTALDFGTHRWPHGDDPVTGKEVTYRNAGAREVTLDLSAQAVGGDGKPAVEGMFAVSPARLVVPAGGTATATLTADTRAGDTDGLFSGILLAAAEGQPVARTAFGTEREVESYDLTIRHLDMAGSATGDAYTTVKGTQEGTGSVWRAVEDADGEVTIRLPSGRYALQGTVFAGAEGTAVLARPRVDLTGDTTVVMDARDAGPVAVTVPDARATSTERHVSYGVTGPFGYGSVYRLPPGSEPYRFGGTGPSVPADEAYFQFAENFSGPSATYRLAWNRPASPLSGFTARVQRSQLSEVTVALGAPAQGRTGMLVAGPWTLDGGTWTGFDAPDTALPARRTEYLLRGSDVRWEYDLYQYSPGADGSEPTWDASLFTAPTRFTRERHALRLNFGVFGPTLSSGDVPEHLRAGAVRRGDTLRGALPMFGDGDGHTGESVYSRARTSLTADGKEVFSSDRPLSASDAPVLPSDEHGYLLRTEVSRPASVSPLSTRVAAEWTFRSARAADGAEVRLPLSVVRFSPPLAADGTAPAGARFEVPYEVRGAAASSGVRALGFEVSYDETATWQPVARAGDGCLVLDHPQGAGSVSLRVHLTDAEGNTVRQTVERAYLLR
ncbi:S8 family serine peptidase [Streptomyces sp. NPDC102406]|uniref:S8 family serine peptidase n=1 Tax=Streptomyces sp. NPDC102406 TaxID=3366171 RepID=UPI00382E1D30